MGRPCRRHWLAGPQAAPPGLAAGPEKPEELTVRGLDDVRLLRLRLEGRPSVIVVGGGPLGMEIASGAVEAGCTVTLVSEEPPMLGTWSPTSRSSW